jgi:hypothetical protein
MNPKATLREVTLPTSSTISQTIITITTKTIT